MAKKRDKARPSPAPAPEAPAASSPSLRPLWTLTALGAAATAWAVFLWRQLLVARSGGSPVCGPGDEGACVSLWDGAFATWVQETSGVPVAGWGVAWGLVAAILPALAILRRDDAGTRGALLSAVKWTAAGGVAAVLAFWASSAAERLFCLPCLGSHVLALAYASVSLVAWRRAGWPEAGRGLGFAAGLTVAAFLVLLVPGTRTPPARVELSALVPAPPPPAPPLAPTAAPPVDAPLALPSAVPSPGAPASPGAVALEDFVATLSGPLQQSLSDALAAYRTAPEHRPARARYTLGPRTAPVRITEFTDVLCPHCADLHRTIAYLRSNAPAGSFQVEPRQYPLDGACNPQVQRMGSPVRCLGARAKICMEGKPGADAFTGALFENQRELTEQRVYELAAPHMPRAELEACVASAETNARLQEDIQEASRHDVTGTPLVLVNGRKGSPYGPFLYAMILNRGLPWHPSFNALPPPRAQDPHGH